MGGTKQKTRRVAVLGGGPTGLSAAYRLARDPTPILVDLYESSGRFGGVLTTEKDGGFLYELGPSSMNAKHPAVADLIFERLGLSPRIERRSADAKNFFIVKGGQVLAMPRSPIQFCFSKLLSWRAKLKFLSEPFVPRLEEHEAQRETVSQFFERRFGGEVVKYIVDPAIAGIYSSSPAALSMKHAFASIWNVERKKGSVIGGYLLGGGKRKPDPQYAAYTSKQLRESFSYDEGMEVLASAMVEGLHDINHKGHLYKRSKVRTLERDGDGCWRINGRGKYDAVISTIPTHALGSIFTNDALVRRGLKKLARSVEYAPASIAVLGFKKSQVPTRLDGFGVLLPSSEESQVLGVNYSSSNFPKRVEDPDNVYLTVYVGGSRSPDLARRRAQDIVDASTRGLHRLLGVKGKPFFARVKTWTLGIPQYTSGYDEMLCTMARTEEGSPGLVFGGNYRDGVGVPDALQSGIKSAERVIEYLDTKP